MYEVLRLLAIFPKHSHLYGDYDLYHRDSYSNSNIKVSLKSVLLLNVFREQIVFKFAFFVDVYQRVRAHLLWEYSSLF
jgi:hypothetical protein